MSIEQEKLRCAIIGYGYMGEIRRAVIERNANLELAGIYEANSSLSARIKGAHVFSNQEEAIKGAADIVFVCTPNCFSPDICIESLKAGKHVFCEKPPGRNVGDIVQIRKAEKKGVKLMFGFNHRFHPGIIKAKVIIDSGRFGPVINVRGIYGKSGGVQFRHSWRNDKNVSGGGILLDQGIHMLDLFRYLCGDFNEVKCLTSNAFWKLGVEDNAYVILRGVNGVDAVCHSSATFWKHTFRVDITLEGGYMVVEGLLSKSGSYGREQLRVAKRQFEDESEAVGNPSEEVTYFDRDLSWDLEVSEFVKCIIEDKPVAISSSEDALKVMEIIEKAYINAGTMEMADSLR